MFRVSVPGSLMLFGEHAVLHGKMAIVTAINARLKVELIPNNKNEIYICADHLQNSSTLTCTLDLDFLEQQLDLHASNQDLIYVLECIRYINNQNNISLGFDLIINSGNLKNSIGFGSSAAVVIGVLSVINKFINYLDLEKQDLFNQAIKIVKKVQNGFGSGADLAASIYGGIIAYKNFIPQKIIKKQINLIAIYCGYKMKTSKVIGIINYNIEERSGYKKMANYIFDSLDYCSKLAIEAIEQENFYIVGSLMNVAHGHMTGLGVVNANLDRIANNLRSQKSIYGSKISGAGLGDCVIGLGCIEDFDDFQETHFHLVSELHGIIWL